MRPPVIDQPGSAATATAQQDGARLEVRALDAAVQVMGEPGLGSPTAAPHPPYEAGKRAEQLLHSLRPRARPPGAWGRPRCGN
jgi:hypothetical protein